VARIWTETYRPEKHSAPAKYAGSLNDHYRAPSLLPKDVLLVNVASFTFRFLTTQQLRECLAYFNSKTHPSSRVAIGAADHWEVQRWFEQLPMYLLEEPKRRKVVAALSEALKLAERGDFPHLSETPHIGKGRIT
jgi:hypothetical protein